MSKPITIAPFAGINNRQPPEQLVTKAGVYCVDAENVDFSNGHMSRRDGFTLVDAGDYHSLWSENGNSFAVKDGVLLSGPLDASPVELATVGSRPLTYADTGGGIYISNGQSVWVYNADGLTKLETPGTYDLNKTTLDNTGVYDNPPAGLLSWAFGRLWSATADVLYHSRPHHPDQFNLADDYMDLPGVLMALPVDDGIYIGTNKAVWFFLGGNPKRIAPLSEAVVNVGVVRGTPVRAESSLFGGLDVTGPCVVWESAKGKIAGFNSGRVLWQTDKNVAYKTGESGASFFREKNGTVSHVSSVQQGGEVANVRATDSAEMFIFRNGVAI